MYRSVFVETLLLNNFGNLISQLFFFFWDKIFDLNCLDFGKSWGFTSSRNSKLFLIFWNILVYLMSCFECCLSCVSCCEIVTHARVWNCVYKTYWPARGNIELRTLWSFRCSYCKTVLFLILYWWTSRRKKFVNRLLYKYTNKLDQIS